MDTYTIKNEDDYKRFLNRAASDDVKNGSRKENILFCVIFNTVDEFDVELLSFYYLIRAKYSNKYSFRLKILCNWNYSKKDPSFYKTAAYCYLVENVMSLGVHSNTTIHYKEGEIIDLTYCIQIERDHTISRKILPLMIIDKNNYDFLRSKIDHETWESIKTIDVSRVSKTNPNLIKGLINSLLFRKANFNQSLYELRSDLFKDNLFYDMIKGLPIIALMIFAMFDYAYREEALEVYKDEIIKSYKDRGKKLKRVRFYLEDYLSENQNKQEYPRYIAHEKASKRNYNNKTLWDNHENKIVHPFVVKELFEAVSVSEGILQLLENVVLHADADDHSKNKIGIVSVNMRSGDKDSAVLKNKYKDYYENKISKNKGRKYYFEICITDLSGTKIPAKFKLNNKEYLKGCISDPNYFKLKDFFDPSKEKRVFWREFYHDPERAIKHYGLQIFDSIISSRNGLFMVDSGDETFCNLYLRDKPTFTWGTRYQILCPINDDNEENEENFDDRLTNDHLFRFKELGDIPDIIFYNPRNADPDNEIVNTYDSIEADKWSGGKLLRVDISKIQNTELFIKGVLKYIFYISDKEEVNEDQILLLAILNCNAYQILEIVRIISLYYDKQGTNNRMSNVQIYIRGGKSGEEILFFGEKLSDVNQNITKSACIRGIMYENVETINYLLKREKENG